MEITEVRVKLMDDPDDRLQAFCSITIDDWFVVRDLKIIDGTSGPFVAMPSRKLTMHCRKCRCKNHLRANFCNQCGTKLQNENVQRDSSGRDSGGRVKLYADIAHPINSECREAIQKHVIAEFNAERELSQSPDYVSRYDDGYEDAYFDGPDDAESDPARSDSKSDDATVKTQDSKSQASHRIESSEQPSGPHKSQKKPTEKSQSGESGRKQSGRQQSGNEGDSFGAGIFD